MHQTIFITGGTGYIGGHLIPELAGRGHAVRALVRPGSEHKLPDGCVPVFGNALDASTFVEDVASADTFTHLVGVPNPGPAKPEQFRRIDLTSVRESVTAASKNRVAHFIYVSVAHPAPVMKHYIAVRMEGERLIRESGLHATILRPWYVMGPGHRWAYVLKPFYWIAERIPSMREQALRMGLVTIHQVVRALVAAVENPAHGFRIIEVPEIRKGEVGD